MGGTGLAAADAVDEVEGVANITYGICYTDWAVSRASIATLVNVRIILDTAIAF